MLFQNQVVGYKTITKVANHHLMQLSFTCKITSAVKCRKRGIKY